MKKITLVAIATLTLFIAGCSQQEADTEVSQEQETEQVTTESKTEKRKGLGVSRQGQS